MVVLSNQCDILKKKSELFDAVSLHLVLCKFFAASFAAQHKAELCTVLCALDPNLP